MIIFLTDTIVFVALMLTFATLCQGLKLRIFVGRSQCYMVQLLP